MAGSDPVRLDVEGAVATITLDAPERKNSLGPELVDRLATHLETAHADDAVRVIVLTNTGTTFCAGADLKAAAPGAQQGTGGGRTFTDVFELLLDGPTPVVGRIAGHATGGGVGLAAACDLSVMDADSLLGFTEVRIGVAPAIISVVCLPKLRAADAMELFLTGERISATRAAEVGLVNRAVPGHELDAAVGDLVGKILRGGPNAVAASKRLVRQVPSMPRDDAFAWTAELSASLFRSEEASAGIAAFRERTDAPWVPPDLPS
ncbi:MAG: enoyl-CoA hydratase-related protein [Actinomycetota bacterium]